MVLLGAGLIAARQACRTPGGLLPRREQRPGGPGTRGPGRLPDHREDRLGRPYAICRAGGTELNRAVVAAGWARADQAQPELKQAEAAARAGRLGVWATGANRGR